MNLWLWQTRLPSGAFMQEHCCEAVLGSIHVGSQRTSKDCTQAVFLRSALEPLREVAALRRNSCLAGHLTHVTHAPLDQTSAGYILSGSTRCTANTPVHPWGDLLRTALELEAALHARTSRMHAQAEAGGGAHKLDSSSGRAPLEQQAQVSQVSASQSLDRFRLRELLR